MNKKADSRIISIGILILIGIIIIGYHLVYTLSSGTDRIIIDQKWIKPNGNEAKYLISSTDGEVYPITDSWLYWRFNSSDLYAKLNPGMACRLKYQGFRFPLFSDYKNIIKATCGDI